MSHKGKGKAVLVSEPHLFQGLPRRYVPATTSK